LNSHDLLGLGRSELREVLRGGHSFEPAAVAGSRYRGISLGLPSWVEALSWKKFAKCFTTTDSGSVRGWNQRIEQDGLDQDWTPLMNKEGTPRSFGFFELLPPAQDSLPVGLEHSCLIHYGRGRNRGLDPTSLLRDPLVSLEEGGADLLFGWTYLDLGAGLRLGTPSYFVLERDGPIKHLAQPPQQTPTAGASLRPEAVPKTDILPNIHE